jgi:uncharacterized protein YndB with AHSA1/START domain
MIDDQQSTGNPATVTTPSDREVYVERVFAATPERVFAAFADPELIPRWWGPHGTTTIVEQMDVRPGGTWRFIHRMGDGSETAFRGVYREVTPPDRLVQTFEWEGMPGHVCVETTEFEDLGDGRTQIKSTSLFHETGERDAMLDSGMEGGMNESFERLDGLLAA